ncbi:hypothetical protein Q9323_15005 [Pseudomonas fulva]|uniref:hypothetical protein n=1 Tax=Pseudomonas fulva TaxID=47880 RepID=UPI0031F64EE4
MTGFNVTLSLTEPKMRELISFTPMLTPEQRAVIIAILHAPENIKTTTQHKELNQ